MTEKDFYLLCVGFENVRKHKARERRQLLYTIVSGYADPKKLPPMHRWMPLEDDEQPKGKTEEEIKEMIGRFKGFKNGRSR